MQDASRFAAAVILTHHPELDHAGLLQRCPLVVDTRNVTRGLKPGLRIRVVHLQH